MQNISFPYLFELIDKAKSQKERKELLIQNQNDSIKRFLKYTFDKNIKFLLPEGTPPYRRMPDGNDNTKLIYGQLRLLYLFVDGESPNIPQSRREMKFIEMLESVTPEEADLLLQMKDKKLKVRGLTSKLVTETFPGLIDG